MRQLYLTIIVILTSGSAQAGLIEKLASQMDLVSQSSPQCYDLLKNALAVSKGNKWQPKLTAFTDTGSVKMNKSRIDLYSRILNLEPSRPWQTHGKDSYYRTYIGPINSDEVFSLYILPKADYETVFCF